MKSGNMVIWLVQKIYRLKQTSDYCKDYEIAPDFCKKYNKNCREIKTVNVFLNL